MTKILMLVFTMCCILLKSARRGADHDHFTFLEEKLLKTEEDGACVNYSCSFTHKKMYLILSNIALFISL